METKYNDFREDLEFSHSADILPMWETIYNEAFPDNLGIFNNRGDGELQRNGIDRTIVLPGGKAIYVDEKVRRVDYKKGDIFIEFVSNDKRNSPGWAEKRLFCDYIAYAIIPTKVCYLLPVPQMQAVWKRNKDAWIKRYGVARAKNETYTTLGCPVPVGVLYPAIGNCFRVRW